LETSPACMAGVLTSCPNFSALWGQLSFDHWIDDKRGVLFRASEWRYSRRFILLERLRTYSALRRWEPQPHQRSNGSVGVDSRVCPCSSRRSCRKSGTGIEAAFPN